MKRSLLRSNAFVRAAKRIKKRYSYGRRYKRGIRATIRRRISPTSENL